MQRVILALGLIGVAFMLQGCGKGRGGKGGKGDAMKNATAITACRTAIKAACDAIVGEVSAAEVKKLASKGKGVCDGWANGTLWANPTKYSACQAKLAQYQQAIGGHGNITNSKNVSTASLVGEWENNCKEKVRTRFLKGGCRRTVRHGINASDIGVATDSYLKTNWSKKHDAFIKQQVTDKLAELAKYTSAVKTAPVVIIPVINVTAVVNATGINATAVINATASRLYDATELTTAHTSVPFLMLSLGASSVIVVGLAALSLKQFLQNRVTGYSASALLDDEDEEEAAGFE